ncbi:D-glycero-beta-D-manno-heptose 1-phosphate adenylyltransferase [bacterium]|nr:MAG: D-glycero-beta-D-manno-heptose 1-phosphate adenylyltransferase [bacterium]
MSEFFAHIFAGVEQARTWREEQRAAGRRVVFTNGCFDVLHAGHVMYLAWARKHGDALIVGLNGDESVRALKGAPRPINPYEDRAHVLAGLRSVDGVVRFDELTPERLIEALKPDAIVKSAQYREEDLPEAEIVRAYGGEVLLAPHLDGHSTSEILRRGAERTS